MTGTRGRTRGAASENEAPDDFNPLATESVSEKISHHLFSQLRLLGIRSRAEVTALAASTRSRALTAFDAACPWTDRKIGLNVPAVRFKKQLLQILNQLVSRFGRQWIRQEADKVSVTRRTRDGTALRKRNLAEIAKGNDTLAAAKKANQSSKLSTELVQIANMKRKFPAWNPPPKCAEKLYPPL